MEIEQKASRERLQITKQLERNVHVLKNQIAPNITPPPINSGKVRILGLYQTDVPGEWYLMRRQREGWNEAERKLMRRNMTLLHRWDNVSHAVDVGNLIKKHCRRYLSWDARGNRIKARRGGEVEKTITDEYIFEMIQTILSRENCAHELAKENNKLINKC